MQRPQESTLVRHHRRTTYVARVVSELLRESHASKLVDALEEAEIRGNPQRIVARLIGEAAAEMHDLIYKDDHDLRMLEQEVDHLRRIVGDFVALRPGSIIIPMATKMGSRNWTEDGYVQTATVHSFGGDVSLALGEEAHERLKANLDAWRAETERVNETSDAPDKTIDAIGSSTFATAARDFAYPSYPGIPTRPEEDDLPGRFRTIAGLLTFAAIIAFAAMLLSIG